MRDFALMDRASFGTTKYCNSFISGRECTNSECLYLHRIAPKEDCFLRNSMTVGDYSFFKATHPGHGSYWDRNQQMFLYHKKTIHRSGNVLPDYREHIIFGLDKREMDLLVRVIDFYLSIKIRKNLDFY